MIEIEGINELVRDFTAAPGRAQRRVVAVVARGAHNVTNDWRKRAEGLAHAPLYPESITDDVAWKGPVFEAEIGPDKSLPQGALGNLIEYGSANNPPRFQGLAALSVEAPKFEKAMTDLADL